MSATSRVKKNSTQSTPTTFNFSWSRSFPRCQGLSGETAIQIDSGKFAIAYAATPNAAPAWPWLGQGFFGGFDGAGGMRKLGIVLPATLYGGPVFNAAGELAGISTPGGAGPAAMLPVSMFMALAQQRAGSAQPAPAASSPPGARMALDQVYEHALRVTLQVLVLP